MRGYVMNDENVKIKDETPVEIQVNLTLFEDVVSCINVASNAYERIISTIDDSGSIHPYDKSILIAYYTKKQKEIEGICEQVKSLNYWWNKYDN